MIHTALLRRKRPSPFGLFIAFGGSLKTGKSTGNTLSIVSITKFRRSHESYARALAGGVNFLNLLQNETEGWPSLETAMDNEIFLNERVEVVARFGAGHQPCVPVKFRRANGREIIVTELGLRTPIAAGRKTIHWFDVTDGEADYRLEFDSERLTWRLTMEGDRA